MRKRREGGGWGLREKDGDVARCICNRSIYHNRRRIRNYSTKYKFIYWGFLSISLSLALAGFFLHFCLLFYLFRLSLFFTITIYSSLLLRLLAAPLLLLFYSKSFLYLLFRPLLFFISSCTSSFSSSSPHLTLRSLVHIPFYLFLVYLFLYSTTLPPSSTPAISSLSLSFRSFHFLLLITCFLRGDGGWWNWEI